MVTFLTIFFIIYFIGVHVGFYKIYEKAGEDGWKALVPLLGIWTRIQITGRPWHWFIYFFIPIVNIFCWYYTVFDLLKSFGKTRFKHSLLGVFLPFIYLPYLGFSDKEEYNAKASKLPKILKSKTREWVDAIAFAVIAATLIRWSIMEAFTIPTPSMEKSLLVGDFLFVSKFHYGTRTPKTPLQIPLTHQEIPGLGMKSYLEWIQLPQYRLPGITEVKRNDVVVFNVPGIEENEGIERPIDLKTNYIKRCVGIPGDVLEIRDRQVYIDGEPNDNPGQMQFAYKVTVKNQLRQRILESLDISEANIAGRKNDNFVYLMQLTNQQVEKLKNLDFVVAVEILAHEKMENEVGIYPKGFSWNVDWYGPLEIPYEGMEIEINEENLRKYGKMIRNYEHLENVMFEEDKLYINGNEVDSYTFMQNYYFMMGDNRHNSLDSRFWGFVPEDHVVGKGFFIWLSLNSSKSLFDIFDGKIRWKRFFKMIE